ncbi:MAG: M24 family metallopeptidase, partial [Bacteroidota bacterium]
AKSDALGFPVEVFSYTEDLATWPQAFGRAMEHSGAGTGRVGVEPRNLRVLELRLLEAAAKDASFVSAEEIVSALRMFKDESEISMMRNAVHLAQNALERTLPLVKEGITEREVASELTLQLMRGGSEPELPFNPIVAFGAESANPHASPADRGLEPGMLVLIDWGANLRGYMSDLTRTFAFGDVDAELVRISEVVRDANKAGREAAGPGVPAGSVDDATRSVVEEAGYGQYFIHRTGHGLGLEAHEEPYIRAGNDALLEPGMAFTVEPGIYLPGRGGVRIEDDVVITNDGAVSLSDLPRDLIRIG